MAGHNPPPPAHAAPGESTLGNHGYMFEDSPAASVRKGSNARLEDSLSPSVRKGSNARLEDSPAASVRKGRGGHATRRGRSPTPSDELKEAAFGSYDFGRTPRRSVKKVEGPRPAADSADHCTSNGARLQNYSNRFISDRL